jgi:propanol-preferring alcohol dehydrogenase
MRAVRFHGAGRPVVVEDVEAPRPGPGEVLIDVAAAGVCGTELHFLDGLLTPARTPITLGHEVAGTVAAVGEDVTGPAVGDRVAVHYLHACGRCRWCRSGEDHLCDEPLGFLAFATDGGFAEQLVVPASAAVPVPEGVDLAEAATLCCSGTTALHAADVAGVGRGAWAVVYGAGGVGLALVQVLRELGARPIAVARNPQRLALAAELGAEVTVDASREDVAAAVRGATGGRGADVVIEASGSPEAVAQALDLVRDGGRVIVAGHYTDNGPVTVHPHWQINRKHVELRGCWGSEYAHFHRAVALAAHFGDRVPWGEMVSGRYGLAEAAAALAAVEARTALKAVIEPGRLART